MKPVRERGIGGYVLRRLRLFIPTLLGVTFFVFLLCQLVPGGPVDQMRMRLQGMGGGEVNTGRVQRTASRGDITEAHLKQLRAHYDLDRPFFERYGRYLWKLARLDLGDSHRLSEKVIKVIAARFPVSIYYGLVTTILMYAICIPLGIVKAIRHRTIIDNGTSILIFVGYAVPNFALGSVLLTFLSVKYDVFPLGGIRSENFADLGALAKAGDIVWHSVLPLICYMVGSLAFTTMLMKNSLIENMSADYVRTALANGITWRRAVFVHALRNSLIPIATGIGGLTGILLTGSVLVERVFNIQGIGLLFLEMVQNRDYPVVMGLTLIGALLLLAGNLISDVAVAAVDPRVRFE